MWMAGDGTECGMRNEELRESIGAKLKRTCLISKHEWIRVQVRREER